MTKAVCERDAYRLKFGLCCLPKTFTDDPNWKYCDTSTLRLAAGGCQGVLLIPRDLLAFLIFLARNRLCFPAGVPDGGPSVKLAGDDRVLNQKLERDDFESVFVSCFEDDGAGGASLLHLKPASGTDAPAVAWFQAGKAELRHRSAEVIAERLGGFKKGSVDDAADGVDTEIVRSGFAAAGAVKAGHRLAAADVKGLAEDVLAAVFDG